MNQALFLNGVFEEVLEEIQKAQKTKDNLVCFLQPYSGKIIKLLEQNDFKKNPVIPFYISTTTNLNTVIYTAEIVGWENKREIIDNTEKLAIYNEQIVNTQPIQESVYFFSDAKGTKECVNLIFVKNLKELKIPFSTSNLTKISDNTPLLPRSRSGNWSYVEIVSPQLIGATISGIKEKIESDLSAEVKKSLNDSTKERKDRLDSASEYPETIQVISKGYRRNADVIAEVLFRANGVCESCNSKAPFIRKKDDTPYLEVHHKKTLATGGKDTVKNSEALCPNCHRQKHFGK
jgi:predicted HNH restriction endonuclease